MQSQEAIRILENLITPDSLTTVQVILFEAVWEGKAYPEIAEILGYDPDYVKGIGSKLWRILSDKLEEKVTKRNVRYLLEQRFKKSLVNESSECEEDWGEAVDVSLFYGRQTELEQLSQWIIEDQCRLVGILGIAGIGKTTLAIKIGKNIKNNFDFVIWRSLRNAPLLESLLEELISFIDPNYSEKADIKTLLSCLRKYRCLIILDNLESLLKSGHTGEYRREYQRYGEFFHIIGETEHQSCLLVTSREKIPVLSALVSPQSKIRSLLLKGASETVYPLLEAQGFSTTPEQLKKLSKYYDYNPLALKLVCASIQELFSGDIEAFFKEKTTIFNGVRHLLEQQFQRLSNLEKSILFWLAINREWTNVNQLKKDIFPLVSTAEILNALESLSWRSLIEVKSGYYTQQPLIMEYMTEKLIEQVSEEIIKIINSSSENLSLFNHYALMKTTVKEYIKVTQIRLILQPIARNFASHFAILETREQQILSLLNELRNNSPCGYGTGNLINLCRELSIDLTKYNFSGLTIWQADLQGMNLQGIDFSNVNFANTIFTQPFGLILTVAWSRDGSKLASGNNKGEIHIYSLENIQQACLTCLGHLGRIISVSWSPDDQILASGSLDNTIKLWDLETGEVLRTLQGHNNVVMSVVWSLDNRFLISASEDCTIKFWNWQTGEVERTFLGHEKGIRSVCLSPDNRFLASGSEDCTIIIWDINSGEVIQKMRGHTHGIWQVAFHPQGHILASTGEDGKVILWDVKTGKLLKTFTGHTHWIYSLSWSKNGEILASGSVDRTIRLWDIKTGAIKSILGKHSRYILSIAFHPYHNILVSSGQNPTLTLWDYETGKILNSIYGYTNGVRSVVWQHFSPTQKNSLILASSGDDCLIRLWDITTGQILHHFQGHNNIIWTLAWSKDGQILASGSEDKTIKLWDIETGKVMRTIRGHTGRIWSVAWHPYLPQLASGSSDCTIKLWELKTGQLLQTFLGHNHEVTSIAFSPIEAIIASGSEDRTVRFWDLKTGEILQCFARHSERVVSVKFSPNGKYFASASIDKTVRILDVKTGKELSILKGHTNRVLWIEFSGDGELLASAGADTNIRLWEVKTGKCLQVLQGHDSLVWSVSWHFHNQILASGSDDETIKIWEVKTGKCLQTLVGDRPLENMNIQGVTGLTETQKANLSILGAIEN